MAARKGTEDNYYRRAQIQELIRTKFAPIQVGETDEDEKFFATNPQILDDDDFYAFNEAQEREDLPAAAKILLGDQWDAFKAWGGQAWLVFYHLAEHGKRESGTTPDGTPTP